MKTKDTAESWLEFCDNDECETCPYANDCVGFDVNASKLAIELKYNENEYIK